MNQSCIDLMPMLGFARCPSDPQGVECSGRGVSTRNRARLAFKSTLSLMSLACIIVSDMLQHQLVQVPRRLHGERLFADRAHLRAADVPADALPRGAEPADDDGAGEHVAQRPHT